MHRSTLTKLALLVFGLVFVSFVIRGFGQFVVGQHRATLIAGPIAVLAGAVLLLVVVLWALGRLGVLSIDERETK